MVFVMATGSDVFGECVEGINVLVAVMNIDV
jgi:hypothetical protein